MCKAQFVHYPPVRFEATLPDKDGSKTYQRIVEVVEEGSLPKVRTEYTTIFPSSFGCRMHSAALRFIGSVARCHLLLYTRKTLYPFRSQMYCFFSLLNILHHVLNAAMQNPAKRLDRMRTDALVSFQPRNLRRADMIRFNQRVLRDASVLHCFP